MASVANPFALLSPEAEYNDDGVVVVRSSAKAGASAADAKKSADASARVTKDAKTTGRNESRAEKSSTGGAKGGAKPDSGNHTSRHVSFKNADGQQQDGGHRRVFSPSNTGHVNGDASDLPGKTHDNSRRRGPHDRRQGDAAGSKERHSRSAPRHEGAKHQYSGRGNWGNPTDTTIPDNGTESRDSLNDSTSALNLEDGGDATSPIVVEIGQGGEATEVSSSAAPKQPALKTVTEYLAEQARSKKPLVALPEVRRPTESAELAGLTPLPRKEGKHDDFLPNAGRHAKNAAASTEAQIKAASATETKKKIYVDLAMYASAAPSKSRSSAPSSGDEGRRGGRGGKRGDFSNSRSDSASHSTSSARVNINLADQKAFPPLSAKKL